MYLANVAPNHLSPIDSPLLARLCVALAYADEANDKIEELGLLVKAPNTGLPIKALTFPYCTGRPSSRASSPPNWRCRPLSAIASAPISPLTKSAWV